MSPMTKAQILLVWIGGSWLGLFLAARALPMPWWLIGAGALLNIGVQVALVLSLPPASSRETA